MSSAREELDQLLSEDVSAAKARAAGAFARLAGDRSKSLVLFGAGNLGRKVLTGLRRLHIEPLAFSDNNQKLWGTQVEGIPVLSPEDAAARFRDRAAFLVTVWGAGQNVGQADFRRQLEGLGCTTVIPFAFLYWQHPDVFLPYWAIDLPHKILEQAAKVREAFELFAEPASQTEFVQQLRWRLHLDFDAVNRVSPDLQYFPRDIPTLPVGQVFVDCGAYTGDTLENYLQSQGDNFRHYLAFEPDPANFERLRKYVAEQPASLRDRITVRPEVVGGPDQPEWVSFDATGTAAAALGKGNCQVPTTTLDKALSGIEPTFIKMDIEGAELDALAGAAATIRRCRARLAICAYHCQDHLWHVPLAIRALSDSYQFFLRPHNRQGYDLVCYAVPRS
jgi:FkbM family methyltransferase